MGRTNVGRGGRGGRGGGRGLSDHAAARGWGQKSIQTNTSSTHYEKNTTMSSDTCVQEAVSQKRTYPNVEKVQTLSNKSHMTHQRGR